MHVYVQIDPIQCSGLLFSSDCVHFEWHSMDLCPVYYAKIEIGSAQSDRYDLFHATVDDNAHSPIGTWIRRFDHNQHYLLFAQFKISLNAFAGYSLFEFFDTESDSGLSPDKMYFVVQATAGAFIAFAMEISEFLLLSYTSSLTLSIAGIFKV